MALKIGRVGIDVSLRNPGSLQWKGDVVQIEGHMIATSAADLEAIREQLLGYATNGDEPCVPVSFDTDATVNGFYTIAEEPEVASARSSYATGGFLYPYRVALRRVPRFASPFFESSVLITNKVSTAGGVGGVAMIGLPGGYYNFLEQIGSTNNVYPLAAGFTRSSEDGNLDIAGVYQIGVGSTGNLSGRNIIRYGVSAANYYLGGCKLSFGSPLRVVTAPQTATGSTAWSMSNGVLKASSVAGTGDIDIGFWGGSYRTKRYRILTSGNSGTYTALPAPSSVQVVKVSTHVNTIRLFYSLTNAVYASGNQYLDLTLRRGSPTLEGVFTRTDVNWYSGSPGVRLAMATAEAATAGTGYIWATTQDGANLKYVILACPTAVSSDLVNGSLTFASAVTPKVAFGFSAVVDPATTGASAPNRIGDISTAFFTEVAESIQVVS